jgi:hypothetical protein
MWRELNARAASLSQYNHRRRCKGPFAPILTDVKQQARMKSMGYSRQEGLAEKFHIPPPVCELNRQEP